MKKKLLTALLCCTIAGAGILAQSNGRLSLGLEASSTGLGLELATPLSPNFALRGGVSLMPQYNYNKSFATTISENIKKKINEEVAKYPDIKDALEKQGLPTKAEDTNTDFAATASLGFVNGKILVDYYPLTKYSFHFTVGCYIGASKLLKYKGEMNQSVEILNVLKDHGFDYFDEAYIIELNKGYLVTGRDLTNIKGAIETNSFKPYLGLGFGRSIPRSSVGISFEIGAFYQGTPKITSENANIQKFIDDKLFDVIGNLKQWTFYPVISLKLNFRLF